jgi:predicted nuclease of predicted toxin-antitoxin system
MNLYLDDNSANPMLVAMLRRAGHTVAVPADVGLSGASDARHLDSAIRATRVVLTADRDDFRELHDLVLNSGGSHPGILLVRYDNDPKKDMKPRHIVAAIAKLERSGLPLRDQIIVLNQWR